MKKIFDIKKIGILFLGVTLATLFYIIQIQAAQKDQSFHLYFLNVGQGDSILIKTPANKKILIDGGPNNGAAGELGKILSYFDRKIDLVILTHPHADHLDGLNQVLKYYQVAKIISTGVQTEAVDFREWQSLIKLKNILLETKKQGDHFCDFQICFDALWPNDDELLKDKPDLNETSLVLLGSYQEHKFLLTGDIDERVEKEIISANPDLAAEVLKIPHHGSKTGLADDFLQKVSPKNAVISVGENSYGHPSDDTLAKINNFGIRLFRTDINGRIDCKIQDQGFLCLTQY